MTIPFRASSLLRALGPAMAALVAPTTPARPLLKALALATTDVAARRIDSRGISLISVTPDDGKTYTAAQELGSKAVTTGSWVGANLLVGLATDRLPLPRAVTAVTTGISIYLLDCLSDRFYDSLMQKAEAAKQQAAAQDS